MSGVEEEECRGCGHRSPDDWCSICSMLVPHITGDTIGIMPQESEIDKVISEVGQTRGSEARLWPIIRQHEADDADWIETEIAPNLSQWIIEPPPAWTLDDQSRAVIRAGPGQTYPTEIIRRLQRGGILPDGSYLTWQSGQFYYDGKPTKIPFISLEKALAQRDADKIDWKKLLLSIDLATSEFDPNMMNAGMRGNRRQSRYGREVTMHPFICLADIDVIENQRAFWRSLSFANRFNRNMNLHIRKSDVEDTEWFQRWNAENFGSSLHDSRQPEEFIVTRTLIIVDGKLFLRMRRGARWSRIPLPDDPKIWARVVTWALSPPSHADHLNLRCLQYGLFTKTPEFALDEDNCRGVHFLRGIIEQNDRIEIDRDRSRISVEGSSGVLWTVKPADGPHNTRFSVRANSVDNVPLDRRRRENICVVETPDLRELVLGDAIGTIVLALLDDLNSQAHIGTIQPILHEAERLREHQDVRATRERYELRMRLRGNRAEQLINRATITFPRLWSVFLRRPLGSRMTFTAVRANAANLHFDGCETSFSTRGGLDRAIIYAMLRNSGWMRDQAEEQRRGILRVYRRENTGSEDLNSAVEEIADFLEPTINIEDRICLVPRPVWTYFERGNPGPGQLLPNTDMPLHGG